MSVLVENKSRAMWERMYGQQPSLPQELQLLLSNLQQTFGKAKDAMLELPAQFSAEMGRYLQLVMNSLAQVDVAAQEKQVAGKLLEKFGTPTFAAAVPTFNLLTSYLHDAERIAKLSAQEMTTVVNQIKDMLFKLSAQIHEEKIRNLEAELKQEEDALLQFSAQAEEDQRLGIRAAISRAKKKFRATARAYKEEIRELRLQQDSWLGLANALSIRSGQTQASIARRYEVDPNMAVR